MQKLTLRVCLWVCTFAALGGLAVARAQHAPARSAASGASASDRQYLKSSLEGDLFEVQGGGLAKRRTKDPATIALADTLIADHRKSFDDGTKLAEQVHAGVPKDPSPSEQWELKMVGALAGRSFRHWYASLEVYDHRQDIEEATSEAQDGSSPAVRKEARAELPMLRKHLKLAQRALTANP